MENVDAILVASQYIKLYLARKNTELEKQTAVEKYPVSKYFQRPIHGLKIFRLLI